MRIVKFAIFALALLVMSAGPVQAGSQTFTGCLTKGGSIIKVAVGDAPAKPCQGNQEQVTWVSLEPLVNVGCEEGTVLQGFDGDGLPICVCVAPFEPIPNEASEAYYTISGVNIVGTGRNFATVAPGETFVVEFDYSHAVIPECPGCIIQFQLGFEHLQPEPCAVPFVFAPTSGTAATTFTAPMEPGVYYILARRTLEYNCLTTWDNPGGTNWTEFRVASICVK